MLAEFSNLENRDPRQYERVVRIIRHLLRHQFIHTDDRGSAALLEGLLRADVERLVSAYFEIAGYTLVVREAEGWAGIVPDTEQVGLPRLRIDETIVLLLLRRLWEEGVQDGEMERHGNVEVTLNEAYDAYQDTVARARRPSLAVGEFKTLVEGFGRKAVVRLTDYDPELQDYGLTIRALIATVAGDDVVDRLEKLLLRPELADQSDEEAESEVPA
ncbi:hypothetical protein GCM10007301_22500 [Azorhizobium oxalatiphilum]|uniref:DUF4194 domain-containing protein n=1 Tax=Azorhizobium oxalatiphilum TaxID=980631 RepID=A0A917BXH0_9HYPH|nr:DUF4194 domain-containing protein [Azorhizobium oxalatiphilum]GGF62253.1 hypothetical protein GCM10007301_22500 [Azorhizobium oxalatiphilum]